MASVPGVAMVGVVTGNQVIMAHRYNTPPQGRVTILILPTQYCPAHTDQAQRQKLKPG